MQRLIARKLFSLLLLLALIAGGQGPASMAMAMSTGNMSTMDSQRSDMDCKACGMSQMATAPCDAICATLPAIDTAAIGLVEVGSLERWMARCGYGASHAIVPDPSPPRA